MKARNDRIYTFHSTHSAPSVHITMLGCQTKMSFGKGIRVCSLLLSISLAIAHAIHALKHFISSHLIANNFQATISQMPW